MLQNTGCHGLTVTLLLLVASVLTTVCCHSVDPARTRTLPESPAHPTMVYTCAESYIRLINSRANMTAGSRLGGLPSMVYSFIETLCRNDTGYGRSIGVCLYRSLPNSVHPIDKILASALNLTTLSGILHGGCNLLSELHSHIQCIIREVMDSPAALTCIREMKHFFQAVIASNLNLVARENVDTFCTTWGSMVNCIAPYIAVCSETLTDRWNEYGSTILNPGCRTIAFTKDVQTQALERASPGLHQLFTSNSSAVSTCARQFSHDMLQFTPTSVFNHSTQPSELIIAFTAVCEEQIQPFMYCMDEKRLNATTPLDEFMFQIMSTVNMRVSYNKLCSKLDVLTDNINCLQASALEIKQCMCFMEDLTEEVELLTAKGEVLSYDELVEPFCGSYVSFVECYVGLLSSCNADLGYLMSDVYLGVLTSTCLNANTTSCSGFIPSARGSAFLQCGEKVAMYLRNTSMNPALTDHMEYENMIQHMEDLVVGSYAYTCSIGAEILTCMKEQMLPSQNAFDRLLRMMFDTSKFPSILLEGCHLTLIKDVKARLKFILSTMMSNPETSQCIDAMNKFAGALKGNINLDDPGVADPYCRVWADFSECIESQLACSSPQLVDKWRTFTVDALTPPCYEIAIHQQMTNQFGVSCTVDEVDDSAMSICGMDYMLPYQARAALRNHVLDQVDAVILEEIDHFCDRGGQLGREMIQCLQSTVPASFLILDRVVSNTFDFNRLEGVLKKACALRPALKSHMVCIVDTIQRNDPRDTCVHHLVDAFNLSTDASTKFNKILTSTCRAWYRFVDCVDPHLHACDPGISHSWRTLSIELLSDSCETQLSTTLKHHNSATEVHMAVTVEMMVLSFVTVLCSRFMYTY